MHIHPCLLWYSVLIELKFEYLTKLKFGVSEKKPKSFIRSVMVKRTVYFILKLNTDIHLSFSADYINNCVKVKQYLEMYMQIVTNRFLHFAIKLDSMNTSP